jgi:hypothetical protein
MLSIPNYPPCRQGKSPNPKRDVHQTANRYSQNGPIFVSCKIPEFFKKSPLSKAEKHPDFQVTSCHQNVSTNVDFAYIKSE